MLLSSTLFALTFVSGIAAAPADVFKRAQVVLGYRTVDEAEAIKINDAGSLVWDDNEYYGGRQLGAGKYLTPKAGQWTPHEDYWYCVVYCDDVALDRVAKMWVPSTYNDVQLWNKQKNIEDYIKHLNSMWNPDTTLRMSIIQKHEPDLQLLLPGALVPDSGGMNIRAVCKKTVAELPDTHPVNYDDWNNNIAGDKNPGSDPGFLPPVER